MSESKLNFDIENYNEETEGSFSVKARFNKEEDQIAMEVEYYGSPEILINTFMALYQRDEKSRALLNEIINHIGMMRLGNLIVDDNMDFTDETPKTETKKEEKKDDKSGDVLSS